MYFNFGKFRIPIFPIGKKSDFVSNFQNFRSKSPFVGVTFFVKIRICRRHFFFTISIFAGGSKSAFVGGSPIFSRSPFLQEAPRSSLARTVPSLARAVPSLARAAASLARAVL